MKKATALALAAVMVLSAVPTLASADEAEKTARIGVPYDPTTMDYAELNVDPATYIDSCIADTLIRNQQGTYVPGIAESWEVSEDAMEWTFKLKEGLTYSDGTTPVTAEDLEYAAKRLMDPEAGHYNAESGYILANGEEYYSGECSWDEVGVEVIDDLTIKYTFAYPQYESSFTSTALFAPLEQAFVEECGAEYGTAADKLLTNGPFIVTDWVSDSEMTISKNENYWDKDSINMDSMILVFGATGDTGVDMMLAGELDFVQLGNKNQRQTLEDAGFASFVYTSAYRCMNVNLAGKDEETGLFMSNVNFRKALNCAIDRTALTNSVMTAETPAYRLTAPSEPGDNTTFDEEYAYEGWSATADAEKAQEYLQAALDELGKTIEDVPAIELLCYESQGSIDTLCAIQDMLKTTLGIESYVDSQTIQVMVSKAMTGDFDLWYGGNGLGTPDCIETFLSSYTSSMTTPLRGYANEEFDALIDTARMSSTLEERRANYFECEKFFCENVLNIILGWTDGGFYYRDGYTGFYSEVDTDFTYLDYEG